MARNEIRSGNVRTAESRVEAREEVRPKKTRLRKGLAQVSPTHIPQEMIPEGVDFQWVTDSIHGMPEMQMRHSYEINAWEPVLADAFNGRFDGMFMPKGYKGEINVMGQVLMWRPIELTMEARQEEAEQARNATRAIETKLRNGQLDGVSFDTQHPTARAVTSISHDRVSMPIPE